jgi:hypothetical protein
MQDNSNLIKVINNESEHYINLHKENYYFIIKVDSGMGKAYVMAYFGGLNER